MNRFRGRKKAKDDMAAPRPSVESETSLPFKMFGKKKSVEEEPKMEVDLATALPSNDDFRTSLLMTNLSARFSMLREQDDPNTKVGKASDDSVLFPKRQSRMMMDFGYGAGLSDIAEVESIKAPAYRVGSFGSDDAASTSGSVMNRSKPTEGNNLFGGRQKIYKIPAGGASKSGGLPGRALYEDDVAQSAFQKWRQAERERRSLEETRKDDTLESETARPESPSQPEYNRRRETSSTTSSGPSGARNSTAATSINSSQRASSVKDWQSSTSSSIPAMERSVTRTRRLYEQGLNQDLHDHQSSALSRIDTLSKQRSFGARTPDLTTMAPSPTTSSFSDRFANSRSILSKGSAPNLRSFSPPTAPSSQMSPVDSSTKLPGLEPRSSFGATPPLSPPISETEDHAGLPIGPNDKGKATAMGVFNKPATQYDETRYAQRQIQLQQGRETPTNRFRTESNASAPTSRSRSSSAHRTPFERHDSTSLKPQPTVQEEGQSATFFDDDDDEEDERANDNVAFHSETLPQVTLERPSDQDHPAFRKSALPTPLSLNFKPHEGPATIDEGPESSNANSKNVSPEDSPTLGPTSGLSGMVRQHLRNESNSSSIYDNAPDVDLASRFPPERDNAHPSREMGVNSNPWEAGGDWAISVADGPSPTMENTPLQPRQTAPGLSGSLHDSRSDVEDAKETDEFARHLADGARRVRERLTSYVEAEPESSAHEASEASDLIPPPRNGLGIIKSKSSRGSLMERKRPDKEVPSQLKAKKLLGFGSSPTPPSPSARQTSFEINNDQFKEDKAQTEDSAGVDGRPSSDDKDENVHAGLKAFRQARRELQRMKELEVQQRHKTGGNAHSSHESGSTTSAGPQPGSRPPSAERRPPPVTYNRGPSEDRGPGSRSGSRAPSERDRSGSETSSGGRSRSRPARLRNGSNPVDENNGLMGHAYGPNGTPRQGPMMRSPGLPGTDIKRSPHMPPQPYPSSPGRFNRSESAQNLTVGPYGAYDSGQPSPISPMNGIPSPYGPSGTSSPRSFGGSHQNASDAQHPATRIMRSRDGSEHSFPQGPTAQPDGPQGSRARSGSLLGAAASTPNLHGNMTAPPVPPINPRRKNNMFGGFMRRNDDEATMSSPHLPMISNADDGQGVPSDDDDRVGGFRQRVRKTTGDNHQMSSRSRTPTLRDSPPQPMKRPPFPPTLGNNTMPGGMI